MAKEKATRCTTSFAEIANKHRGFGFFRNTTTYNDLNRLLLSRAAVSI